MKFNFNATNTIFVHHILNPPTERKGCDITLKIINNKEFILSKNPIKDKFRFPSKSSYELKILNPLSIGFTTAQNCDFFKEFRNLILAMNLSLSHSCVTSNDIIFTLPRINFTDSKVKQEFKKIGNKIEMYSENNLIITTDYYNGVSLSEYINETYIIEIFNKLQKLNRFNNFNLTHTNIIKSLNEYEKSVSEIVPIYIFKYLFNVLELSTNSHKEKTGSDFDKEVSTMTSISENEVYGWREFYNRIKHVDKLPSQSIKYINGIENISSVILPLRRCCRNIIAYYLNLI